MPVTQLGMLTFSFFSHRFLFRFPIVLKISVFKKVLIFRRMIQNLTWSTTTSHCFSFILSNVSQNTNKLITVLTNSLIRISLQPDVIIRQTGIPKVIVQGKLIAVAIYSAYIETSSLWAEFINKNRCISVSLVSEENKRI